MPPTAMTANTSIQISESIRRKLSTKTAGSTGSGSSSKRGASDRKSAIDAALGKYVDEFDDDIAKRSSLGRKGDKNDLGVSEHSTRSRRRASSGSKRASRTADSTVKEASTRGRRTGKRDDDLGTSEHSARPSTRRGRSKVPEEPESPEEEGGFCDLNDDEASVGTGKRAGRSVRTGRKKTDRERAASPGPMKKRSSSVGAMKKRTASPGPMKKRAQSPGPIKHPPATASSGAAAPPKRRSSSVGPLKHKPQRAESLPLKKRTESPGPMKKRAQSPGKMKQRSGSVGALSRKTSMRSQRVSKPGDDDGALEGMLGQVTGGPVKKRGGRSVASAPAQDLRRPEAQLASSKPIKHKSVRAPSATRKGIPSKSRSADAANISSAASQMDARYNWEGHRPSQKYIGSNTTNTTNPASSDEMDTGSRRASPRKAISPRSKPKRSMSALPGSIGSPRQTPKSPIGGNIREDDDNELAKRKVKRNNSMAPTPTREAMSESQRPERGGGLTRAQSMMLHRDMTRRGKSNSLMDLIQYKEEEIHSTSYFASNHVLVNRERMKRGLRPLTRNIAMDELARKSAQAMAESNGLNPLKTTYVGNVLRGESIRSIHRSTMQQKQGRERANLLNPYFQEFGVGTCKGSDGMLYMCQLFSEQLEIVLTDTTS